MMCPLGSLFASSLSHEGGFEIGASHWKPESSNSISIVVLGESLGLFVAGKTVAFYA
jgi:hypothetical protein